MQHKTKCEMCEEMHVCHDGYCKKCLEQLGTIIDVTYILACAFTYVAPYLIGLNEIRKEQNAT